MIDLEHLLDEIIRREGGYVNDPDDPGGPTKYGVTVGTMRRLRMDLDGDGDVDANDVKLLTVERAKAVFKYNYFEKPRIDELPLSLQATVMDMYINSGGNGIKILQRMLNTLMGQNLAVDGALGRNTLRVAGYAAEQHGELLTDAYGIERRNYYYRIADRNPKLRKYARRRNGGKGGWITRAEEFMRPRYHFSLAQHRERTRRWV